MAKPDCITIGSSGSTLCTQNTRTTHRRTLTARYIRIIHREAPRRQELEGKKENLCLEVDGETVAASLEVKPGRARWRLRLRRKRAREGKKREKEAVSDQE